MQDRDAFYHRILHQVRKTKSSVCQTYKIENDMLKHCQSINGQLFYPIVLPHMLIGHILELSHNKLGHNGINRTYAMLKRLYYWKGMKTSIAKHIENCDNCQKHNIQVVPYAKLHLILLLFQWNLSVWISLVNYIPLPNQVINVPLL